MSGYWIYKTRRGTFSIRQRDDGRWIAWFEDEDLGSYHLPPQALEALKDASCERPSCGRAAAAELPAELSDWTFVRV